MATVSPSESPGATAQRILAATRSRPGLPGGPLLCLDGPSGSGKTVLAAELVGLVPQAVVVHTDDLLDGWGGLPRLPRQLADLLAARAEGRAEGRPIRYRRYDWYAGRYADWVPVPAEGLLIIEGVGSGTRLLDEYRSTLVWVEATPRVRQARALARDGAGLAEHWAAWQAAEAAHFRAERTRERADLVVDTERPTGRPTAGRSVHGGAPDGP